MNDERLLSYWPFTPAHGWMDAASVSGLVSVVIPTYQRAALIAETLASLTEQTYGSIEAIIVDDGSEDDTAAVVREWKAAFEVKPERTCVYLLQEHSGAPAARNRGLLESHGEFIQFLDSDDLLHPYKLERQVAFAQSDESVDFVYGHSAHFAVHADWQATPDTRLVSADEDRLSAYLLGACWPIMSGLFRRTSCLALGPWREDARIMQDWDYSLRFLLGDPRVEPIDELLFLQRRGTGDRITSRRLEEDAIRSRYVMLMQWLSWITDAGRLGSSVKHSLSARAWFLAHTALIQGHVDLAREVYLGISDSVLCVPPSRSEPIYAIFARLPAPLGAPAARCLRAGLELKERTKRRVISYHLHRRPMSVPADSIEDGVRRGSEGTT